jgi:hypothetical protein
VLAAPAVSRAGGEAAAFALEPPRGFKGPADFCVVPEPGGLLVVVPDLVQSELRFVRLAW